MRPIVAAGVIAAGLALAGPAAAAELRTFEGPIHEHTAYSDGEPLSRPADVYEAVRQRGSDFVASTDHSDTLDLPIGTTNTPCLSPRLPECAIADDDRPQDSLRKWAATAEQARAARTRRFAAIRGFEWTNDRHGHINVLFSAHYTNAKVDGGYADMATFWDWFARSPTRGGGADGIGTFNHPGRRELGELVPGGFISPFTPDEPAPGADWDAFAQVPAANARMVGMELFNPPKEYGTATEQHRAGSYGEALDAGWHVGAIGAEDVHDLEWGLPEHPKTVVLAPRLGPRALRAALLKRRFYAVRRAGVRLSFRAGRRLMGSRLRVPAGRRLRFRAHTNQPGAAVHLVTTRGRTVARAVGRLRVRRAARRGERWYFVRVVDGDGAPVAYSSPIWVTARRP